MPEISNSVLSLKRTQTMSALLHMDSTMSYQNDAMMLRVFVHRVEHYFIFDDVPKVQHGRSGAADANKTECFQDQTPRRLDKKDITQKLFEFVSFIYESAELSSECIIIGFCYLQRILEKNCIHVDEGTCRPLLTTSLLLASKVWDDFSMLNKDFSSFLGYDATQINRWERTFLSLIDFDVSIKASLYAKIYFDFRKEASRYQKEIQPPTFASSKTLCRVGPVHPFRVYFHPLVSYRQDVSSEIKKCKSFHHLGYTNEHEPSLAQQPRHFIPRPRRIH